jgi:hypothetical protein
MHFTLRTKWEIQQLLSTMQREKSASLLTPVQHTEAKTYLINCAIRSWDKLDGNGPLYKGMMVLTFKPATFVGDAKYENMPE